MSDSAKPHGILVIDDEVGPRESLRFLFKNQYDVFCVDSVDHGLELMSRIEPDVIILDIRMPGKTGLDGLKEIRDLDPDVSIVMLTGFGSLETAQEAMRHGATDYIRKPFDTKEMRDTVERYIERTGMARKRTQTSRQLESLNAQLELELAEMQNMATLGRASTEFVHDVRNLLTVICGYANLLMEDMRRTSALKSGTPRDSTEYLEIIARNAERCREMATMWRDLGKKDSSRVKPCRVAGLLRELADNVAPLASQSGGRVSVAGGPEDSLVMADAMQLARAFQNVLSNAVDALDPSGGGCVQIQWAVKGDALEIAVRDNGCGIAAQDLPNLFKPRFTTKSARGGMGIGLYLTRRIIEETHGGTITLANNPDRGAVATIRLPLAQPAA